MYTSTITHPNDYVELQRMYREAIVAHFKIMSQNFTEEVDNYNVLSENN